MIRALLFLLFALPLSAQDIARDILAPLLDPAKVATLKGDRPANTRLYKVLGWLEMARQQGDEIGATVDRAQAAANYGGTVAAKADKAAILWSFRKLDAWGCFSGGGLAELKKGGSPVITIGEHAGAAIALDHVLPRAVVPELAARFYNLEAIPAKENLRKSDKITVRELLVARRWAKEGLLSEAGLDAVEMALSTK